MTTRTILLTLAASVAPLYAQQPTAPVAAAQVFTALATPPQPSAVATPDQRAQVFSALALLPPDIVDVAVLTNVGGNLLHLAQSGKLPELEAGDIPAELLALDNIALATSPATPASYVLLQRMLVGMSTVSSSMQLAEEWAAHAKEGLSDTIIEELLLRADSATTLPEGTAENAHVPATYLILTSKPGEEAMLAECANLLLADLREAGKPGVSPVDADNGFSGIRIDVVETYREELDAATSDMAPRRRAQLLEQLAKHPVCLLTRQQGNALIIALCEKPQDLRVAGTPDESVLATSLLAACDPNLNKGMIAAARVSKELAAINNELHSQPGINLARGMSAVFARLAEGDSANQATYWRAAGALNFISGEMQRLMRPVTQPCAMQMWCDGDLHITLNGDAQGGNYSTGVLRLAAMADAPATTLYLESTPAQLGVAPPEAAALIDAAFNAAEGFSLTLKEEERAKADAALTAAKAFVPELRSLAEAASIIGSGLNGQVAFVMDSTHGQLPSFSATQPGMVEANIPRFSFYAGVNDRSQLSLGWDALLATAGQIAGKLGASPQIVNLLPISSRQVGSAMSYSITLPFLTPETLPSVAVTDSGLALGTSANLNLQMLESATGTQPYAGAAFALKFAPLAKTLRSLATAIDPAPEEAVPVASSKVRLENVNDSLAISLIENEEKNERTRLHEAADDLSTAAAIFEHAATVADGVYGACTVEDGQHVIRMEIKMK